MTTRPTWHGGYPDDVADAWMKEPDIAAALELAAQEHYYAEYCGYDRLMRAAKAEIERLRAALHETVTALEALRRGHGAVVSGLCFPALNIGREALDGLVEQ